MAQHTFTSPKAYQDELKRRASTMRTVVGAATKTATIYFHSQSVRRLTEYVYSVPVPTRSKMRVGPNKGAARGYKYKAAPNLAQSFDPKTGAHGSMTGGGAGKPLWRRTGLLRMGELLIVLDPFRGKVYNATKYAKRRHDLPKTRFPGQIMAPAPWQADTRKDKNVLARLRQIYGKAGFTIVSGED